MKAVVFRQDAYFKSVGCCAAVLLWALCLLAPLRAAQAQMPAQDRAQAPSQSQAQAQAQAQERDASPAKDAAQGSRCGSVVVRHCRRRRETSSTVLDPTLSGRNGAPMQWEVVQFAGPDADDIVVNGERIRDPAMQDVFDRTFGSPLRSGAMVTRTAFGGARCTTIARSGAVLCSNGGGGLPVLDNPLTDWTF